MAGIGTCTKMINALFRVSMKNSLEGVKIRVRCKSMMSKPPTISLTLDSLDISDEPPSVSATSNAMKAYLDRVQKYNKFMTEEKLAFDIGRRHLANMMGRDVETFTQADIDESIQYLFPSSLYQPAARPLMKPPEEIFPPKKEAEFDESGRPHHFLFYTAKPNYYQILHEAVKMLEELDRFEDKVIRGDETKDSYAPVPLDAAIWIAKDALERQCCEPLTDREYEHLKLTLERIANHPYGNKYFDFVSKFCLQLTERTHNYESRKPKVLEDGRQRVYFRNIRRKSVIVDVWVTYPGSGKFVIDGADIRFFPKMQHREAVLFPLVMSKMVKKVDVEAKTSQIAAVGAHSALAVALRMAVARGLYHFVDDLTRDKMKLAGLLSQEIRLKERKKPGQEGARRKFTWKKR